MNSARMAPAGLRSFKTHRLPQRLEPPLDVGRATAPELSGGEDGFDWLAHWYPVMWAQDLLEGKPTKVLTCVCPNYSSPLYPSCRGPTLTPFVTSRPRKVTLFDEEYCLLRRPASLGGDTMCLKDACPHRLAALSEGRMTSGGLLQCVRKPSFTESTIHRRTPSALAIR